MFRGAQKRRIAWLTLIGVALAMTPLEAIWSWSMGEHDHHELTANSAPCPDESPDHQPCSDDCLCLCCPGHSSVLLRSMTVTLAPLAGCDGLADQPGIALPDEENRRVFRPPRSA